MKVIESSIDLNGFKLYSLPELSNVGVKGDFDISTNKNLISLKGSPSYIGGDLFLDGDFDEKEVRKLSKVMGQVRIFRRHK